MAKSTTRFICQECGAVAARWEGQCRSCQAWNSLVEEAVEAAPKGLGTERSRTLATTRLDDATLADPPRLMTGIGELDRVAGGGLVAGSALLIGGDPGIGKSTVLLQAAAALARSGEPVLYVTGEEADAQIRLRARRLGLADAPLSLATATSVRDIVTTLEAADAPRVAIIDSIQTMFVDTLDSAPGTVAQVRTAAQELARAARRRDTTLILVGHVTKDGQIAGPRVVEHLVDTVLYFEGDRRHQFRILRAVKNRFGPTDEIGVFEMTDGGLQEVANPSALFLNDRERSLPGAAVFAGLEGTRPILVEIEALVAPSHLGTPRRTVVGWEASRLAMLIAVLDARCGLSLGAHDVYLNVTGGLRIAEPAADLAVAAALVSSFHETPLPPRCVAFGEIGLSGEIRGVNRPDRRLREAEKLGFERAFVPRRRRGEELPAMAEELGHLRDLVALFATETTPIASMRPR